MSVRIEEAIILAANVHRGQVDKAGMPYILHPLAVMLAVGDDPVLREAAVLHDVIEDCEGMTPAVLAKAGISPEALALVEAVTRKPGESYYEFVSRIIQHSRAAVVLKLADMEHNASRLHKLAAAKRGSLELRYGIYLPELRAALKAWDAQEGRQ